MSIYMVYGIRYMIYVYGIWYRTIWVYEYVMWYAWWNEEDRRGKRACEQKTNSEKWKGRTKNNINKVNQQAVNEYKKWK